MLSTADRVEKPRIGIFGIGLAAYFPGPTFHIGNTNSRIRFPLDPATFVTRWSEEGPTHHCALGVGDQAAELLKVGHLLGVPSIQV